MSPSTPSLLTWLRSQGDRVAGYTFIGAGAACLVVGAVQISRSPSILSQLSYMASAGLIGLFLAIVGVGLLVTADLHDEWRKLDRIEAAIRQTAATPASSRTAAVAEQGLPEGAPFWQTVPAAVLRPVPVALMVIGALGLAAGFLRTSRTISLDDAFQGMALSVTGLTAVALAAAAIVVTLRRNVGGRVVGALSGWADGAVVPATSSAARSASGLVLVPELGRYHRAGCTAVAGLATVPLTSADRAGGARPCGICDAAGPSEAAR